MKFFKNKSFTIVETLITLVAISIMIVGPISFVVNSFDKSRFLASKVVAENLAQEGIELVTSGRNSMSSSTFATNIYNVCQNGCAVDWNGVSSAPTFTSCNIASVCSDLYTTNTAGDFFYRHNTGTVKTSYKRLITITKHTYSTTQSGLTLTHNSYLINSRVQDTENPQVDVEIEKGIYLFK